MQTATASLARTGMACHLWEPTPLRDTQRFRHTAPSDSKGFYMAWCSQSSYWRYMALRSIRLILKSASILGVEGSNWARGLCNCTGPG